MAPQPETIPPLVPESTPANIRLPSPICGKHERSRIFSTSAYWGWADVRLATIWRRDDQVTRRAWADELAD